MADLTTWLRRLRGRAAQASATQAVARRRQPRTVRWALLESTGSPPLGAMYADLLRQAGIPVRLEQWDPGGGALGGLSVGVRILVPEESLAAAREVLRPGEAGKGELHEG